MNYEFDTCRNALETNTAQLDYHSPSIICVGNQYEFTYSYRRSTSLLYCLYCLYSIYDGAPAVDLQREIAALKSLLDSA